MKYTEHQRAQFARAQECSRKGDGQATLVILRQLVDDSPDSAVFNATFANALKESGDMEVATTHFRKAVSLAPKSETFSLGLFHVLWGQGRKDEALEETKRFIAVSDSIEYRDIIASINTCWPRGV